MVLGKPDLRAYEDWGSNVVEDGDELSCLRATAVINGCFMHLVAIEVGTDLGGLQVAANDSWQEELEAAQAMCDGALETCKIGEREYALIAFPHGK